MKELLRRIFLIIQIFCILLLTGCWDAIDVNSLSLVTLVITDRQDEDFLFFIELPNLTISQGKESTGGGKEQYVSMSSRGKTFTEARTDLDTKMDKPVFLGTVRTPSHYKRARKIRY